MTKHWMAKSFLNKWIPSSCPNTGLRPEKLTFKAPETRTLWQSQHPVAPCTTLICSSLAPALPALPLAKGHAALPSCPGLMTERQCDWCQLPIGLAPPCICRCGANTWGESVFYWGAVWPGPVLGTRERVSKATQPLPTWDTSSGGRLSASRT